MSVCLSVYLSGGLGHMAALLSLTASGTAELVHAGSASLVANCTVAAITSCLCL